MYKYANNFDRETLEKKLAAEPFERTPVSFYRYVRLTDLPALRNELYRTWSEIGVLGRIYLAEEGINAQINVPEHQMKAFRASVDSFESFKDVPFKVGLVNTQSFIKLTIKLKQHIVAHGLSHNEYDIEQTGTYLEPEEFNQAMEDPETIVIDMRNHYESRIGHFENAVTPDADTFREEIPMIRQMLEGKEDKKILLYCTGGIRCVPVSAYLKKQGFKDVNQLHGGVINYGHAVREGRIKSKYRGKNFVFDERLAEPITPEIITNCDQCGEASDRQINCKNETCHLLFIQCERCGETMNNSCSKACADFASLPIEERRRLRKNNSHPTSKQKYEDRLRPRMTIPA